MKYIVNTSNDPAYNIALEAYAFRELVNEDELFILWINRPAIIVGKHQNTIKRLTKNIQMLMVLRSFVVCLVVALFITI